MRARTVGGNGVRRVMVVTALAAAVVTAGARPAAACSPPDEALIDEVTADHDDPARATTYVGVVEARVVAHAPRIPILTTRRSVAVPSRTWGDIGGVHVGDQRYGEYLRDVLQFVFFCPAPATPRAGDVTMTAAGERDDGSRHAIWMAEERYRFDPTFPGGLSAQQEEALTARFGPPQVLAAPPMRQRLAWWLWAWLPWLVLTGLAAVVVGLRRRLRSESRDAGSVDWAP